MNKEKLAVLCVAALSIIAPALAQNDASKPPSNEFYRLDFALKEMDGSKLVKTHNYQMMVSAAKDRGAASSIRSGARIPTTDAKGTQYIDVGVNLDVFKLTPTKDGLELDIVVDASGVLDAGTGAQSARSPVIDQTKWTSRVEIPLGKPTTVFSSDDPSCKHQMQLEVTATPIH